jgi:deoxyinosine 3'endonuclease (endonuclease V)
VNSSGYAHYRAVGDALYIGVLGNTADVTDV